MEKNKAASAEETNVSVFKAPTINLPKGGGAIRGMGEKFAANPVTGTGSMTIPIATSPGRSGFGPQLNLLYDSGSSNGPFGFGWSLSLPAITRKTDKGLPQYNDAEESDVYILSGAEDLVPVYRQDPDGSWVKSHQGYQRDPDTFWVRDQAGRKVIHDDERDGYKVRRYRPRIEGLFARIERWTRQDTGEIHWRSISRDNITTLYGLDNKSRIFDAELDKDDPAHLSKAHPKRIFSWLICQSYDDKGNAILYDYIPENEADVDFSQANERNRIRFANRYLKHIYYGNRSPYFPQSACDTPPTTSTEWLFEVVFDYGEHDPHNPTPSDSGQWICRNDPFSSYRAGFEIRTYRLCQRVLMFHRFAELDQNPYLVRSTDFMYCYEQDAADARNPIYSFLVSATQTGYRWDSGDYITKSLPPLEFAYSPVFTPAQLAEQPIQNVDAESLENLPIGLDGTSYQWVDLDGEGASGILTEQAGVWYYKRNLSADDECATAHFGATEVVARKPMDGLGAGAQFLDLAGDGQVDLVQMNGPVRGFYERTNEADWEPFRSFDSWPNVNIHDPNLKFADLTGDGHADILITESEALTWHPSLAEKGFGPSVRLSLPLDEERGPRLVFADGTQSIYLADLSGDGLTDLVRIRNGEVCYWPNLGYGRFGAKVTMDNSPWFDAPDQFNHQRIRLADIDGSGTTDIIYLHRDGAQVYFNQSGNRWSDLVALPQFPPIDSLASVQVVDLLGNSTACLVWSSPLPGASRQPIRYLALMPEKPHLLVNVKNNLGAETAIQYAPSTKFYLSDKKNGNPWITRLPFPVHVVERVTVSDKWRKSSFTTTYSYHHGYFDGMEREFRGFGRVEQIDTETFDKVSSANAASPYITDDKTLYQPPVKTVTWFHTGAFVDREHILSHFADEYFPKWFEELHSGEIDFQENDLPEPDLAAQDLTAEEWREALRACKGMPIRQEVYELDIDLWAQGKQRSVKLFSAAYHNCHVRCLQPQDQNPHAVFLVTESEAITYHYELDLRPEDIHPDPRVAHTLNLKVDGYGNALQSIAVVYPRLKQFDKNDELSDALSDDDLIRIQTVQDELHLAYTETRYTDDVDDDDNHRLCVPCEVLTYELTGISPEDASDMASLDVRDNLYFSIDELRALHLSLYHQPDPMELTSVAEIDYQDLPTKGSREKRLVEHVRTLFFKDDDAALSDPLPFRTLGRLGLLFETYKLALTDELLDSVFAARLSEAPLGGESAKELLANAAVSGYLSGQPLADRFTGETTAGEYWIRSGVAGYSNDAAQHFYLPERYTDPFGNITVLEYDSDYDLYLHSTTDTKGNKTSVEEFDFRILAPTIVKDINDNYTAVAFDVLGMPVGSAVMGKATKDKKNWRTESGDTLNEFQAELNQDEVQAFFTGAYDKQQARKWLDNATARFIYSFGEQRVNGKVVYSQSPACACGILREQHVKFQPGAEAIIRTGFEYSDGMGQVLVTKSQAEPERDSSDLRWIASGKTILNNKGKPVKQYEPYFSPSGHTFEVSEEAGVTSILYYDAPGRLIRTELPDGAFSRVDFSPWHVQSFDTNDTVLEPGNQWYADHTSGSATPEEQRAADVAAEHANTPTLTFLDSLGREVISIAHNRVHDQDEKYSTFTKLDAEGKPLWIRDARGNLVMQYILPVRANNAPGEDIPTDSMPCYDIAGNLLFQHSMDAGDRWMITDAAGKPLLGWDLNERQEGADRFEQRRLYFMQYDALHRPTANWLCCWERPAGTEKEFSAQAAMQVERFEYQDAKPNDLTNRNGQLIRHYDPAGLVEVIRCDFKGNLLEVQRRLNNRPQEPLIDWQDDPEKHLEAETFTQVTEYDALNRMIRLYNWHQGVDSRVAVYEPHYNERGILAREDLIVRARKTVAGYDTVASSPGVIGSQHTHAIQEIGYNAKGQKEFQELGNGTITRYEYDPQTFRLRQLRTSRPKYDPDFPKHHSGLKDDRILQQLHYTYDPSGNITEIHDEAYEPVFFDNQEVKPVSQYEYDALYRLTAASGRENGAANGAPAPFEDAPIETKFPIPAGALRHYTEEYQYDEVGNFIQMRHGGGSSGSWTRNYETAADSNRLLRTWEGADSWDNTRAINKITYEYDTHGNMLNLSDVPVSDQMRWDHRDMVQCLNLRGGGWAYYNYDAGKQRTRKRLEKAWTVEERIYLGGLELYRKYDAQGNVIEEIETIHLFEGEQRMLMVDDVIETSNASMQKGPLYHYQYSNHLGSACLDLDENAGIISYEEYHPYGTSAYCAVKSEIETPRKRYRYTGKERDEESGLYYHGARYYAPWQGRWTSCDPVGFVDGINLYVFVKNNPVLYTDPTGKMTPEEGYKEAEKIARLCPGCGIQLRPPNEPIPGATPLIDTMTRPGESPYEQIMTSKATIKVAQVMTNISLSFLGGELLTGQMIGPLLGRALEYAPMGIQKAVGVGGAILGGIGALGSGFTFGEAVSQTETSFSLRNLSLTTQRLTLGESLERGAYSLSALLSLGSARAASGPKARSATQPTSAAREGAHIGSGGTGSRVNDVPSPRNTETCVPAAAAVIDRRFAPQGEKTATALSMEKAAQSPPIGLQYGKRALETTAAANAFVSDAAKVQLQRSPFYGEKAKEGIYIIYVPLHAGDNKATHAIVGWITPTGRRFVFDPSGANWAGLGRAKDMTSGTNFTWPSISEIFRAILK